MIQEFYKQENPPDDLLDYNAGSIAYEDGEYIVTWAQFGAEKTFSVGQPIYDEQYNLVGYLGIGLFKYLERSSVFEKSVPEYYWRVCLPTEYCKDKTKVRTYWQRVRDCRL